MTVSIIIPCYNSEKYISATLESALNQTYPLIEIICVDNGSTDNTLKILSEFASKHPTIHIYNQPVKGAANARNMGIENSTGDYLQFLDSDDEILPTKIEKQIEFIQSHLLDVVVSDRAVYDENIENCLEKLTFSKIVDDPLSVAISDIIITGNPLYRKSAVVKISGYKPDLRVAQDWDFHIRLFLNTDKIGYLPGYFLKSRRLSNSLSSNWIEVSDAAIGVIQSLKTKLLERKVDQNFEAYKKIVHIYLNSAICSKQKKDRETFIKDIREWSTHFRVESTLTTLNKAIFKIVGLLNYIRIKSCRFHK